MGWNKKAERTKFKTIPLTYSESEWEKLKKFKDINGLTWEEFFFQAGMNLFKK